MDIKCKIRTIPHFPKKGIMFRDITTLLKDKEGFRFLIDSLYERYKGIKVDYVAGIESRGFIIGGSLAHKLGAGFIPIRKKGKLPCEVHSEEYELEYGKDCVEMHKDALKKGDKVIIVDDLLATAGTMQAAIKLVEKAGGEIIGVACVIELASLGGRKKLKEYEFMSLVQYDED